MEIMVIITMATNKEGINTKVMEIFMEIIIILITHLNNILDKIMLLFHRKLIIVEKLNLGFHQVYMELKLINQNQMELIIFMEVIQFKILLKFTKLNNKIIYQGITSHKNIKIINFLLMVKLMVILNKIKRYLTIQIKTHHKIMKFILANKCQAHKILILFNNQEIIMLIILIILIIFSQISQII